ncbi:aryl-alcohol dehydrogenase-like predicted oxidoreductase [Dyadobacter jejuensis]|uniref:Aryl-alcohol dehydrogenase-like predicted oxidoreductase n=1 Tax=Dyadobacter jejuensis TaxID=1082580 RepID=A0A316AKP4_9BACT|nr:aldo/keto reductase [Dyadobacter jejuensis]PWJ58161.1 aryl-alcohol dehydrogenase-like predicted oxidoreductase [Dyadobacter jejuensis]
MKKRILGRTGLEVSEVAFGGVEIGLPYGIGVADKNDMLSENQAISLLHEAMANGINFFDTARMYGESEQIMGKAFGDRREEVILATKCRHFRNQQGQLLPEAELKKFITNSLKESLEALKTDYIDVFMLHQADQEILQSNLIADTFQELKQQGVIRATGASTYLASETALGIERGHWDVIQLPFNLMDQRHAVNFQEAQSQGVGLVVRSVLLKGLLSDRGKDLHPKLVEVERHIGKYQEFIAADFPDLPTLATRFALSFDTISSVLVGIDKTEYLYTALATANGKYMDRPTLVKAMEAAFPDPNFLNLPYWDKMGWLK